MAENGKTNLQKMYDYQELKGIGNYDYVVRGAEVICNYGSRSCVLNLRNGHGVYASDERPLIATTDYEIENIKSFGMCNKNRNKQCKCSPKLREWAVKENMNLQLEVPKVGQRIYAVTQDSFSLCEYGGVVSFKTSGQTSPSYKDDKMKEALEIVEDIKGSWTRQAGNKDFIGHVQVENSGIYNFCIPAKEIKYDDLGSVFLYSKNKLGWVHYIGAYSLRKRFKEDGSNELYVEIALNIGRDYYIEVDIPNVNKIDYELKGNLDKHRLKVINDGKKEISGVWIIDKEHRDIYTENYDNVVKENKHGITRAIYYLSPWYVMLLGGLIDKIIESGELSSLLSNILNMSITGLGARYTKTGVLLAILLLGFDNLNNYELKRVKNKIQKYIMTNIYLKIEIKNKDYSDRWVYELESLSIWDDKYHYNVSERPALNIGTELEGPKYEKGNFGLLYNFDTSTDIEKLIEELKEIASDIINVR